MVQKNVADHGNPEPSRQVAGRCRAQVPSRKAVMNPRAPCPAIAGDDMCRTLTPVPTGICKDCGTLPRAKGPRCDGCHKTYKRLEMKRLRDRWRRKALISEQPPPGFRRCHACLKLRQLSEFSTTLPNGAGKPHKICDRCLTTRYMGNRTPAVFTPGYFRRRAYAVNSVGRQRLARVKGVKTSSVKLKDLPWVCKPQDIVQLMAGWNDKCRYCEVGLTPQNLTLDHAIPLSRNGNHSRDNLIPCCTDCNHLKAARTVDEFLAFLPGYLQKLGRVRERSDKKPVG